MPDVKWPEFKRLSPALEESAQKCYKPNRYGPAHFDYRKFYHEVRESTIAECRDLLQKDGNEAWAVLNAHLSAAKKSK